MISSKPLSFVINSSSLENSEENTTSSENEMERKRYDRQMRAIGKEAMTQIGSARILVIGCGGLGVEIVKNLMLMGFKAITVFDNKKIVSYLDLNSHFYLNEDHVGSNRLDSVIDSLYELNPYCKLEKLEAETLSEDIIKKFNIVISTDELIVSDYVINISEICHTNGIKFIAGYTIGLFSSSFVDFGEGFIVKDADGEAPSHGIVSGIDIVQKDGISVAIINTKDETQPEPHNLSNDDFVKFHSIEGMTQLNNTENPFKIKVVDVYRFELVGLDVSEFGSYAQGGYFRQVKQEKVMDFKSLKQSLVEIDAGLYDDIFSAFLLYNFAKMDYPIKLHYYSLALNRFISQKGRLPQNYNTEEAKEIISIASTMLESTERKAPYFVDEILFSVLSYTMTGPLNPMCTMLGGLLAQEAQKACTGKFSPLFQWCYLESVNSIPEIITNAIKENVSADIRPTLSKLNIDVEPKNNRYDAQNMIFGADFQQHLTNQKVFLVGAGALGCEYLKNFAMIGLGSGPRGKLTVTDMDSIEVSNLSRQFLFREEHVGKMKSECAAKAAQKMNQSLNIRAMADRVGKETENVFDTSFWGDLDVVVNALDNLEARLYVDSKCVYNQKPLLESGTLGAKANSEVILPFVTNNYGKHKDPPQKQFPECTIHRYPNMIQHTISWAKAFFQSSFTKSVEEAKLFLKSPQAFFEEKGNNMVTLDSVTMYLCQRPQSFEDCLSWSRIRFEELYNHSIRNILLTYPEDFTTSSGARFWSGSKKCPKPIEFSIQDETHLKFVFYGALLYSSLFNVEGPADCRANHAKFFESNKQYLIDVVSRSVIPKYIPNPISRDDDDAKDSSKETNTEKPKELSEEEIERQQKQMNEYTSKLRTDLTNVAEKIDSDRSLLESAFFLTDVDFEKDDDLHMEFITSASNLRARCYNIPEIDVYETKGIAGSIIPAMITTTALITGLVILELYKVLDLNFNELKEKLKTEGDKEKFLERFSNSYVNIGIPFITQSEPIPCKKDVANGLYDIWETINVSKTKDNVGTLGELIEHIQTTTKLTVTSVTYEGAILYTCFMADETKEKRMVRPLDQLLNAIFKSEKNKTVFNLGVLAMDLASTNSDIVTLPTIVYSAEKSGLSEEEKKKLLLEKKKQLLKQKQQK